MIAAYIRVSTDEQADKGNSLTEQRERLASYCRAMGWEQPVFYIDDGYSAKDLNRPAIRQLLDEVEQNKIHIIVTTKLDRFSRNLLDLLQTVQFLQEHDCNYVSASENFDTSTAVGRMTLQLLGTFAEFERERISERVRDNMLSLARNTSKALTKPCYGYDIIDGHYAINEDEAKFVRNMFDLAEQGYGYRMIAKILNDRGSVTKQGKPWDQVSVKRIIQNETVAGRLVYNKRQNKNGKTTYRDKREWIVKESNHPAIISPERFETVQEIMRARSKAKKHADSETYLLTGIVKCGHCERNMKGNTARYRRATREYTYYRYICSSYVLGYGCKHHAVHRDDLEAVVINEIEKLSRLSIREIQIKSVSPSTEDELNWLRNNLARLDKRMQKQIEAYELDLISASDLKAARERIDAERMEIEGQIKLLESRSGDTSKLQQKAAALLSTINGIDRIAAKNAIRSLIEEVKVVNGQMVEITWRL
jgi:site-specific DNA recombinase